MTGLKSDKIDVVIFDQEEVDPDILLTAISHGMLLKNIDQRVLSDRIGDLSQYYLKNEPMIIRAKRLGKERLEAFCDCVQKYVGASILESEGRSLFTEHEKRS